MEGFPALAAGGADQHDVSRGAIRSRLRFDLGHGMFHQAEHAIEVDRQRRTPLLIRHALDRNIFNRPHSMIRNNDIETSKMFCCRFHQRASGLRRIEVARNRMAGLRTTLICKCVRLRLGAAIAECNFRTSRGKHSHRGGANAA